MRWKVITRCWGTLISADSRFEDQLSASLSREMRRDTKRDTSLATRFIIAGLSPFHDHFRVPASHVRSTAKFHAESSSFLHRPCVTGFSTFDCIVRASTNRPTVLLSRILYSFFSLISILLFLFLFFLYPSPALFSQSSLDLVNYVSVKYLSESDNNTSLLGAN